MRGYSSDLRRKLVATVDVGMSKRAVSRTFGVGEETIGPRASSVAAAMCPNASQNRSSSSVVEWYAPQGVPLRQLSFDIQFSAQHRAKLQLQRVIPGLVPIGYERVKGAALVVV